MKKKIYRLKDFDDFLLSSDETARDMGWIMVFNSFKVDNMDLDTLTRLKIEMSLKKYYPIKKDIRYYWQTAEYYSNDFSKQLFKAIDERLKIFNSTSKRTAFYKAKRLIKDEGNTKINKTGEVGTIDYV